MSFSAELTLASRDQPLASTSSEFREFGVMEEQVKQMESYIKALEAEHQKVNAFKRELPLCMQLLHEAIQGSKHHLAQLQAMSSKNFPLTLGYHVNSHNRNEKSLLEEFIPLNCPKGKPKVEAQPFITPILGFDQSKPSWMCHPQLSKEQPKWNGDPRQENFKPHDQDQAEARQMEPKQPSSPSQRLNLNSTHRLGGAFSPFERGKHCEGRSYGTSNETKLALSSGLSFMEKHVRILDEVAESNMRVEPQVPEISTRQDASVVEKGSNASVTRGHEIMHHASRKTRRCWSSELHRRFLSALEQLGGSQAATPKQIRELMKVDGLTNDEVKSHLQKYRLHNQRCSPLPLPSTSSSTPAVALGGIWMPTNYANVVGGATHQTNASGNNSLPTQNQPSYFTMFSNECPSHAQSSGQGEDQPQPPSHSKAPSQGHNGWRGPQASSQGCEESSVGNDANSDNSSKKVDFHGAKQGYRDTRIFKMDLQGLASRGQIDEDDDGDVTEAEDSQGIHNIKTHKNEEDIQ